MNPFVLSAQFSAVSIMAALPLSADGYSDDLECGAPDIMTGAYTQNLGMKSVLTFNDPQKDTYELFTREGKHPFWALTETNKNETCEIANGTDFLPYPILTGDAPENIEAAQNEFYNNGNCIDVTKLPALLKSWNDHATLRLRGVELPDYLESEWLIVRPESGNIAHLYQFSPEGACIIAQEIKDDLPQQYVQGL